MTTTIEPRDSAPAAARTAEGPLVVVENLVKYYPIYGGLLRRKVGDVKAVDGVSFEIRSGEVFGLVGESGCGKSTLGKTLVRLQDPTSGTASIAGEQIFDKNGRDLKRLRRRMQFIFQDPVGSLNPRMPISDIIGEGLLAQADGENRWGDRKVRDKRVGDFLEAVGLRRDYTRRYPHEFSGGQRQRIGIARALALDPDFVVCDEPVSALDVSIQSQVLNLLLDLRSELGLTYLFIAHNLSVVQYISDRVGVMYLGKMMELAEVDDIYNHPRHPYTVALLSAVRDGDRRVRKKRIILTGDVPSPAAPPSGCRFHTRCWLRERLGNPENCVQEEPLLRDIGGGQLVACHWAESIAQSTVESVVPIEVQAIQPIAETAPKLAGEDGMPTATGAVPAPAISGAPAGAATDVAAALDGRPNDAGASGVNVGETAVASAATPTPQDAGPAGAAGPPQAPREPVADSADTTRSSGS